MHEASPHCSDCESALCEALMQEYFSLFYSLTSWMRQQGVVRGVRERKGATAQACLLFEVHCQCQCGRANDSGMRGGGRGSPKNAGRNGAAEASWFFSLHHSEALSQPLKQAGGHFAAGGNGGEGGG